MAKYHIKPNGEPGVCVAVNKCHYGLNIDEHFDNKNDARKAYEEQQEAYSTITLKKNIQDDSQSIPSSFTHDAENVYALPQNFSLDKYYDDDFEYYFDKKTEDYGINFSAPKHISSYIEENEDGSRFYRFEQLDELFDEFDEDDVREGYSMNVPLNTVQQYVSEDLVNYYAYTGETDSITVYDEDEADHPSSLMRLLVHKGELYIIDGNHRFAAARVAGKQSFSGIVMGMDDKMENMWVVPPEYFNQTFQKHLAA